MSSPSSAREALIAEAIGDLGRLLDQVKALQRAMGESRQGLVKAHEQLAGQLVFFEAQITGLTDKVKVQAVAHMLARISEAAQRSIELQQQAMANAARDVFQAELGATLQQLRSALKIIAAQSQRRWEGWLTHAATAVTAVVTSMLAVALWLR